MVNLILQKIAIEKTEKEQMECLKGLVEKIKKIAIYIAVVVLYEQNN